MAKDWSTKAMRHYENQLVKNKNRSEFIPYYDKLEQTQKNIENTFRAVQERTNKFIMQSNDNIRDLKKQEQNLFDKQIAPLAQELDRVSKERDELLKKIKAIEDERISSVKFHYNELSKKIDAVIAKSEFCFGRYVKCIAEQFEKDNVPR